MRQALQENAGEHVRLIYATIIPGVNKSVKSADGRNHTFETLINDNTDGILTPIKIQFRVPTNFLYCWNFRTFSKFLKFYLYYWIFVLILKFLSFTSNPDLAINTRPDNTTKRGPTWHNQTVRWSHVRCHGQSCNFPQMEKQGTRGKWLCVYVGSVETILSSVAISQFKFGHWFV